MSWRSYTLLFNSCPCLTLLSKKPCQVPTIFQLHHTNKCGFPTGKRMLNWSGVLCMSVHQIHKHYTQYKINPDDLISLTAS